MEVNSTKALAMAISVDQISKLLNAVTSISAKTASITNATITPNSFSHDLTVNSYFPVLNATTTTRNPATAPPMCPSIPTGSVHGSSAINAAPSPKTRNVRTTPTLSFHALPVKQLIRMAATGTSTIQPIMLSPFPVSPFVNSAPMATCTIRPTAKVVTAQVAVSHFVRNFHSMKVAVSAHCPMFFQACSGSACMVQ